MICDEFQRPFDACVEFVSDRPFNDRRYAISWDKLTSLGWKPRSACQTKSRRSSPGTRRIRTISYGKWNRYQFGASDFPFETPAAIPRNAIFCFL